MKIAIGGIIVSAIIAIIWIIGWIKCFNKLTQCDFKPSYKAEVLYGVGTLTGVGGILGYYDFGK